MLLLRHAISRILGAAFLLVLLLVGAAGSQRGTDRCALTDAPVGGLSHNVPPPLDLAGIYFLLVGSILVVKSWTDRYLGS